MDNNMLETQGILRKTEGRKKTDVQIPSKWKFRERKGNREFDVVQIEPQHNFLSLKADNISRSKVDYFFDSEGSITRSRVRAYDDHVLFVRLPGELATKYTARKDGDHLGFFFRDPEGLDEAHHDLEQVVYSKGQITLITLSHLFRTPKKDDVFPMNSPLIILSRKKDLPGYDTTDWKVQWVNTDKQLKKLPREKYNEVRFGNRAGEVVYVVRWHVQEGRIILSQEYVKVHELKTFSAKVQIDTQKAKDVLFSEPPFEEETAEFGGKALKVPWLTIREIVGARLAYANVRKKED